MTISDVDLQYIKELREIHGLTAYEVYLLIKEALVV
jgi:hypothetical protein